MPMVSRTSRIKGTEGAMEGKTGGVRPKRTTWDVERAREDGEVEVADAGAADVVSIRSDRGESGRLSKSSAGAQLRGRGEVEQDT